MLPEILLDDIRFQELVSEARERIVRHSPGWTEHNVSDPGITLIELFAWLTEILTYRINRIPERLHLGLLELVGIRPGAPECAAVDVRFLLAHPGSVVRVPVGTEVSSPRTAGSDAVVFQTIEELVVPAGGLVAYGVQRAGRVELGAVAAGTAQPVAAQQAPFGRPPNADDALLLGFDVPLAGLVIRLTVESSRASGSDLHPADARLTWEASGAGGSWHEATVLVDETQGFSLGGGDITLELPPRAAAVEIAGQRLHWIRCRLTGRPGAGAAAGDARPAEITTVRAVVAGGTVPARHAATVFGESLTTSDGIAGGVYPLARRPVLAPEDGETLEVRELGDDRWRSWQQVDSFSLSSGADRHFLLDLVRGEVRFGPAIRQPDGGWRRYGAVPPAGASLRFSHYRHGGGSAGNVAAGALTILALPVPGVASVTNPRAGTGGVEAESLDGARQRAQLEIRARTRAVTAEDFERLTLAASPGVARAVCVAPDNGGPIRLHVLPRIDPADRLLERDELVPDEELLQAVAGQLDARRLLGTSIRLLPVRLRGVSVVVEVRASPPADLERVQEDIAHALYVYLNPLIGGSAAGPGDGWPLGRTLNQGELFGIAYGVSGVEFVNILRMYETDTATGQQAPQPTEGHLALEPDELIASGRHIVKAIHRE